VSAHTGVGLDGLRAALGRCFAEGLVTGALKLGPADGRLRAQLHALGAVLAESADEDGWRLQIQHARGALQRLAETAGGHPLHALLLVAPATPT